MKKRFYGVLLVLCMLLSIFPQASFADSVTLSGSGTEDAPYIITTKAELFAFADIVNGTNGATRNTAACAIVTSDIGSFNGESIEWTPMGSEEHPYKGTFKCADNVTIYHLKINESNAVEGANQLGLFGYIENATIDGVELNFLSIGGDTDIGGIAGVAVNSTIKNCLVRGEAHTADDIKYGIYGLESIGGIVGRAKDSHIISCTNECFMQLKADDGTSEAARHKVGGIVGVATLSSNAASEADAVLIDNCSNSAYVSCTTENNYQCTGGIVGRVVSESVTYRAVVKECTNSGKITSIESGTGGIVGYARNASIEDCTNTGSVRGTVAVGGIAGYAVHGTNIIDCNNSGDVLGMATFDEASYDPCYIGGIAGSVYNSSGTAFIEYDNGDCNSATYTPISKDSLIKNCKNSGSVTCEKVWQESSVQTIYYTNDPSEPYIMLVEGACTGGIAGVAVDSVCFEEEGDKVEFIDCENTGAITGTTYTGGLFGVAKNIVYSNCTNTGSVKNADISDTDTIGNEFGIFAYTVRFNACGGTVKPSLGLALNGKLELLPTPEYNGFTFNAWYTATTGGTKITTDTVFNSKATVYAQWTTNVTPETGDESEIVLWIAMLMLSMAVLVGSGAYMKRKTGTK